MCVLYIHHVRVIVVVTSVFDKESAGLQLC